MNEPIIVDTNVAIPSKKKKKEAMSVNALIQKALENNASVETMERLFSLSEKMNANAAKGEFVLALGKFQKECPVIEKKKKVMNKDGQSVRYQYATLDSISNQIKKPISENNFSYSWDVKLKDKNMEVTCKLTHSAGHSETSTLEIPISASEYMTEPQKYASAQTYAKRYTLINVLGITTADEDTDATDVGKEKNAKNDKAKIIFLLRQLGAKVATKTDVEAGVEKYTQLKLEDKNYAAIVERLEITVKESHYESSKV